MTISDTMGWLENRRQEKLEKYKQHGRYFLEQALNSNVQGAIENLEAYLNVAKKLGEEESYRSRARGVILDKIYKNVTADGVPSKAILKKTKKLLEGNDIYAPLRLNKFWLSGDDVIGYVFSRKMAEENAKLGKIGAEIIKHWNKKDEKGRKKMEYNLNYLYAFDLTYLGMKELAETFGTGLKPGPKHAQVEDIFIRAGLDYMGKLLALPEHQVAKNREILEYMAIREKVLNHSKNLTGFFKIKNNAPSVVEGLDWRLNKVIGVRKDGKSVYKGSFEKKALKMQDELYNKAMEAAAEYGRVKRIYDEHDTIKTEEVERAARHDVGREEEWKKFSLEYSIVLEEDEKTIMQALEEMEKERAAGYETRPSEEFLRGLPINSALSEEELKTNREPRANRK